MNSHTIPISIRFQRCSCVCTLRLSTILLLPICSVFDMQTYQLLGEKCSIPNRKYKSFYLFKHRTITKRNHKTKGICIYTQRQIKVFEVKYIYVIEHFRIHAPNTNIMYYSKSTNDNTNVQSNLPNRRGANVIVLYFLSHRKSTEFSFVVKWSTQMTRQKSVSCLLVGFFLL